MSIDDEDIRLEPEPRPDLVDEVLEAFCAVERTRTARANERRRRHLLHRAAPDLLASVQEFVSYTEVCLQPTTILKGILERARAALVKAKGE